MQRRSFLQLLAASSALPLVGGCTSGDIFTHGVASGDPSPDGVLLWTRAEEVTEVDYVVGTIGKWIERQKHSRVVRVTPAGADALRALGVRA